MPKDLHELPKLRDGLSYLYVERARILQDAQSIALWDKEGRTPVPAAALGVLMLGPGCSISHAAVRALVENGCSIVWLGEHGVRCYAQGTGETRSARHILHQAQLLCNEATRMQVVWRMYEYRFGYQLDDDLTLNQIRGMEGARMRDTYAEEAKRTGVNWQGRNYDASNWNRGDPLNRALSSANACLNGVCHAAIVSGGYSPAMGFVHTGRQLSFVYDIADLYKAEITIPLAFETVAESEEKVETRVRLLCRDHFRKHRLLQRLLPDIDALLDIPTEGDVSAEDSDPTGEFGVHLWRKLWEEVKRK
jgi:CRISPR-associated protein Cas1